MAFIEETPDGLMLRGKFGDRVHYKRNGKYYSRRYVKPRDPKTPAQLRQRALFREANTLWHAFSSEEREYVKSLADEQPAFSEFMREYIANYPEEELRKP
ncbi:MAG: hypothetical protein V1934_04445 [Methanobacteriota archaeon]